MKTIFYTLFFLLLLTGGGFLRADDAEAVKVYAEGLKLFNSKEYYEALKKFEDSQLLAKSNTIRANSLRARIGAAKMSGLPWKEFELIEELLTRFPEYADVTASVKREYQLGDMFFKGQREPAFYAMRKLTWLVGPDKTEEIYTKALKRAPYAPEAPAARLRLAFVYDQKGEVQKSLEQLRIVERTFPESTSYKVALLALSYGCYELAVRGDGDGRYARECADMSAKFLKLFPDDVSAPLVRRNLQRIRDAQAKRLQEMAEFYRRQGRTEAAARYLARVVREFPESTTAPESERQLAALDKSFTPGDFPKEGAPRYIRYKTAELPAEAERILLFPGENGSSNLLPLPDLKDYFDKEVKEK